VLLLRLLLLLLRLLLLLLRLLLLLLLPSAGLQWFALRAQPLHLRANHQTK
jgi:hypothetical protein